MNWLRDELLPALGVEAVCAAGLHLHKRKVTVILRNDIDLAEAALEVALHDLVASFFQIFRRQLLAEAAGTGVWHARTSSAQNFL